MPQELGMCFPEKEHDEKLFPSSFLILTPEPQTETLSCLVCYRFHCSCQIGDVAHNSSDPWAYNERPFSNKMKCTVDT